MVYRNHKIVVTEAAAFKDGDAVISAPPGEIIYKASSLAGDSYAMNVIEAVNGAKKLLDKRIG